MHETDHNRQLIRSLYLAADEGRLEAVASCFSPEFRDHDANAARVQGANSLEATMTAVRAFHTGFPDTRHTIHDLIAEGDRVVARVSAEGTHTGQFFGHPPSGRRIRNDAIVIYRVVQGRIVERWSRDRHSVLDQLKDQPSP